MEEEMRQRQKRREDAVAAAQAAAEAARAAAAKAAAEKEAKLKAEAAAAAAKEEAQRRSVALEHARWAPFIPASCLLTSQPHAYGCWLQDCLTRCAGRSASASCLPACESRAAEQSNRPHHAPTAAVGMHTRDEATRHGANSSWFIKYLTA